MDYRRGKSLDVIMKHKDAKKFVRKYGYDAFIEEMNNEFDYDLGSASMHWERDDKYICKMRGGRGDIIIGWEGRHDG